MNYSPKYTPFMRAMLWWNMSSILIKLKVTSPETQRWFVKVASEA